MHSCPAAIYGQDGDDTFEGGASRDWVYGGPGNDFIEGWSERDFLWGDEGNDIITGGLDDSVAADDGDFICGGPGDDRIDGWRGDDTVYGDRYIDDPLYGEDDGNDEIYGGDGNDEIYGGGGHDNLFGEEGDDTLRGEVGDDFLKGANDNDLLPLDDDDVQDQEGENFFGDSEAWPGELPWPELNLVAEMSEVVDDQGQNWYTEGPLANQWQSEQRPRTEQDPGAFGGWQSILQVPDRIEHPELLGNKAKWFGGTWSDELFDIYVTWAPRPNDGAQNAPFYVQWWGVAEMGPYICDQSQPPDDDLIIDGQPYQYLGTFQVQDEVWVSLKDDNVASGRFIIADAVLFRRVNPEDPELPGSHTNREENGFYAGLLLQASPSQAPVLTPIALAVEGPIGQLTGRNLELNFDNTVIKVYKNAAMTEELDPGEDFGINELTEIYVWGVAAGSTELELLLAPIPNDPLAGQRPTSDLVVVNVWA